MPSRASFFLILTSTLLGAPRTSDNGTLGLFYPRFSTRLAYQAVLSVACVCFSVPLFTDLYVRLRVLWIQRQLDRLNRLVDYRTSVHLENQRKLERILEVREDAKKDMEQWLKNRDDLEKDLAFVLFDRELPQCSIHDDSDVEFSYILAWNEQDREILRKYAALKEVREKIEEKLDWVEKASKELNRSTDEEEKEMKRMQGELLRLLA